MTDVVLAVLVSCAVYLLIVVVTNRAFIVAPRARILVARAESCTTRAMFLTTGLAGDDPRTALCKAIVLRLNPLTPRVGWRAYNPLRWLWGMPLTKVAQYSTVVADVERDLVDLLPDSDLDACWSVTCAQLQTVDANAAKSLREAFVVAQQQLGPGGRRVMIRRGREIVDGRDAAAVTLEFDRQRVAFWLAAVGLAGVLAVGLFVSGREQILLFGALGGFLSPVVTMLTSKKASVWGVMVLSPVGGALMAVAGLVLVRFLADPAIGVLGATFAQYWQNPADPSTLAVALLFGFSGRLFSRLAISATSKIGTDQTAATTPPVATTAETA